MSEHRDDLPRPPDKGAGDDQTEQIKTLWGALLGEHAVPGMTLGRGSHVDDDASHHWWQDLPLVYVDEGETQPDLPAEPPAAPDLAATMTDPVRIAPTAGSDPATLQAPPAGEADLTFDGTEEGARDVGALQTPQRPEFRIERKVASGGMGDVFVARQIGLDRIVAIKRPNQSVIGAARKLAEFVHEGTVTGNLEHPGIVPIYQNGIDAKGRPYYAMKLVKGMEWRYLLHPELASKRGGEDLVRQAEQKARSLTLDDHVEILLKLCDAVAYAHSRGVIHRDLKPENVMVGDYGEVQLMDWGLAQELETPRSGESVETEPAGTPAYMSPEMVLAQTEKISYRTDVYLLGATLYEIIAGSPPHAAKDVMTALFRAAKNTIAPPFELNPDAPKGLADIALKAMATEIDERYASVTEFQDAIRRSLRHAQSVRISDEAAAHLGRLETGTEKGAPAGTRYVEYAEVVGSFRQALHLWKENEAAYTGLAGALGAFVRAALAGGDLGLARAQLDELCAVTDRSCPSTAKLVGECAAHDRRAQRRRRSLGVAMGAVGILAVALIGGAALSYRRIGEERDEADRQRLNAVENLQLAQAQRLLAEEQRRSAELERRRAEENYRLAEQRRTETDRARATAQESYELAERRRSEAERSRRQALRNLASVDVQRAHNRIESDRDHAQAALYVLRAIRTMGDDDSRHLRTLLAQIQHSGPRLAEVKLLPAPARQVQYDAVDGLRVLLSNGRIWPEDSITRGESAEAIDARVSLSWGGHTVLLDRDGRLLLDGRTGNPPGLSGGAVSCATTDSAGQVLAVGTRWGELLVYDTARSDQPARVALAHAGGVLQVAFVPRTQTVLTAGADGRLARWSPQATAPERSVPAHAAYVSAMAVSADGRCVATGGADGLVRVWNASDLSERVSLAGHTREVGSIAFRPGTSQVASAAWDGNVRLWDHARDTEQKVATIRVGNEGETLSLSFSPSGRALACLSAQRSVAIWDVTDRVDVTPVAWREVRMPSGRLLVPAPSWLLAFAQGSPSAVAVGGDAPGTVAPALAVLTGDSILAVAPGRGVIRHHLALPRGARAVAAYRRADRLAACAPDGTLYVGDADLGTDALELAGSLPDVQGISLGPGGTHLAAWDARGRLAAGTPGNVRLLSAADAVVVVQAVWLDETRLVVRTGTTTIALLDSRTGTDKGVLGEHEAPVTALDSDGRWLVAGSADGQVRLWDAADHDSIVIARPRGRGVADLCLPGDGTVVCLFDDGRLGTIALPRPDLESDVDGLERVNQALLSVDAAAARRALPEGQ